MKLRVVAIDPVGESSFTDVGLDNVEAVRALLEQTETLAVVPPPGGAESATLVSGGLAVRVRWKDGRVEDIRRDSLDDTLAHLRRMESGNG